MLARRHHRVLAPRGFIVPTNLQSMGFGLPAAIGATLAEPRRPVVALLGDGGVLMSGLELATAVREGLNLTVIVLVDGHYGQIRIKQLQAGGAPFATELPTLDLEALAATAGAAYLRLEGDPGPLLEQSLAGGGVTLVEVALDDSAGHRRLRARAGLRRGASALGLLDTLRRLRRP